MRFAIFGNVTIDKNVIEGRRYTLAGGPPTFISKTLRQLPNSQMKVIASSGAKKLIYHNITRNGQRKQKVYGAHHALPPAISPKIIKILKKAEVLFITPLLPNYSPGYVQKIVRWTPKKTLKILLPQGYFRQVVKHEVKPRKFSEAGRILPLINVVILSDEDYPSVKSLALKWLKFNPELVVIITLAEKGALLIRKDKQLLIPTRPVAPAEIVDPIGCGDVFSAAFAYHYWQNKNVNQAVVFANQIARQSLFYKPDEIKIASGLENKSTLDTSKVSKGAFPVYTLL